MNRPKVLELTFLTQTHQDRTWGGRLDSQKILAEPRSILFGQTYPFPLDSADETGLKGHALFDHDGKGYRLKITESMYVRLHVLHMGNDLESYTNERFDDNAEFDRFESHFPKSSCGIHTIPLMENSRGSVLFGKTTILFKFRDARPSFLAWLWDARPRLCSF